MSRGVYRIVVSKVVYAVLNDGGEAADDAMVWACEDGAEWEYDATRLENGRALCPGTLASVIHGADGKTTVREALAEYEGRQ